METFESRDLSGDFENGANENARVNEENEYFNENGGLCLPIVTCTFHKMFDFIAITVEPHRPSKQTVSSC